MQKWKDHKEGIHKKFYDLPMKNEGCIKTAKKGLQYEGSLEEER